MSQNQTEDVRVSSTEPLRKPSEIKNDQPLTDAAEKTVLQGRKEIRQALAGKDKRLVVITGPCSIHDTKSAFEYAEKLASLREKVKDTTSIVMRVYFEKPRTTVGWKGLIYDPHLDESNDINEGLRRGREILLKINEMGLPCATEFLDPIVPQYIDDLVTWAAIGARTTESQTHRQMASGLSMPVGFKNATDGGLQVAVDAMKSARHKHSFLGIDGEGQTSIINTKGNPDVHLVLRGGGGKPNCSPAHIAFTKVMLEEQKVQKENYRLVMVDCSHGNSNKDYRKQPDVFESVVGNLKAGESSILGVMLESHINEGKQGLSDNLNYGQSITDGCISWETTEELILRHHKNWAA